MQPRKSTSPEWERRVAAAVDSLSQHVGAGFFEDGWGQRRVAEMLAAADREVPVVSVAFLNEDCEADFGAAISRVQERVAGGGEPERDPCLLCGFSLAGHKYVYMERIDPPLRGKSAGPAHLHCSHTLRGARLQRAERELARLRAIEEAARECLRRTEGRFNPVERTEAIDRLRSALSESAGDTDVASPTA